MTVSDEYVLSQTESVCPVCLKRIDAVRVRRGEDIYLRKTCSEHGDFCTVIWRGAPDYASWSRENSDTPDLVYYHRSDRGCPYDCGLCPEHRQQSCCVLLEVTSLCNLNCPVCFAGAGEETKPDPSLAEIRRWYERLIEAGGENCNIQLSGGEPTMRDDLPEIIALGRSLGFSFIQVNSNGLRLAADLDYVQRLKQAGLSTVFLQFDGTADQIYQKLRGRKLYSIKQKAIDNCARCRLGVVLVPVLAPGVNVDNIGSIIDFALQKLPAVRGVHFQPISYFGRYPGQPDDSMRVTLPEVIRRIEAQTGGRIKAENLAPSGCENAKCSFHGDFTRLQDGRLKPLTASKSCCSNHPEATGGQVDKSRNFVAKRWSGVERNQSGPTRTAGFNLDGWDEILFNIRNNSFSITGMCFQDAWNLDLDRLRDCHVHLVSPEGMLIPFCAYNLTGYDGRSLYRKIR